MPTMNFSRREILCKIVYYGPGLCGKTTNLQAIHDKVPAKMRGNLTSVATKQDRTLFFDLLPMDIGKIGDFNLRFQLYTVPGQVYYNASRKIVLKGVDGVVFVADSQRGKMEENVESLQNFEDNLIENGVDPATIPIVLQFNKRDLSDIYTVEELNRALNKNNLSCFESIAITGHGVFNTLKAITKLVIKDVKKKLVAVERESAAKRAAKAQPAPTPQKPVASNLNNLRPLQPAVSKPSVAPVSRSSSKPDPLKPAFKPNNLPKPSQLMKLKPPQKKKKKGFFAFLFKKG